MELDREMALIQARRFIRKATESNAASMEILRELRREGACQEERIATLANHVKDAEHFKVVMCWATFLDQFLEIEEVGK